ncbi:hypothetical protein C8K44_13913 [Aminobacter sp. AP02]|nr:hypothetical protein C8K44_13913 [Aminobacter sp. AP02]
MTHEHEILPRKPARNYRDPNDKDKRRKANNSGEETRSRPSPPNVKRLGGSEQPGYRMKRARFWQS